MSYLALKNLTKRFRGTPAVQDLWLQAEQGEILSLLGPSGCGKSTTLQMIAGVLHPDRGTIELEGQTLNRVPSEKRDIALILQRGLLFPHLTVGENVAFGLKMRGVNRVEREEKAIAMLQQVQLVGFADRRPAELSGGQAQRVAVARALVIRPKLLLLDEPLSALDANLRADMQDFIVRLQKQTGVTMLLVTHDQAEAVVISDRIALMFEGRLRQVDTPEQLYRQPRDQATARFMGGVNFFSAEARQRQWTLAPGVVLISRYPAQGTIQWTIRPEDIQVLAEPLSSASGSGTSGSGMNTLPATVVANRFTGIQRRLTLAIAPNLMLQAWVAPIQEWAIGQSVWVHLPPEALWCFSEMVSTSSTVEVL
ncbi:MAG: ABC transporter ATP-binding protein [Leptolyngbyaceae cyanobacterium CRU_2_3]|nr:ABC transporter ATP-binding protein [Leptolyngbyaceae cyanobacterium CRU_2_3]